MKTMKGNTKFRVLVISFISVCIFNYCYAQIDMEKIQDMINNFELALNNQDFTRAKGILNKYISSDNFNSHVSANIVDEIIIYPEFLELAERIVIKSIEENTIENLRKLHPHMGTTHNQNLDYCWLYSQYAWILWKKKQNKEAQLKIEKAIAYLPSPSKAEATELIRFGIISYDNGYKQKGWENIKKALLMDTQIEKRDKDYIHSIQKIIVAKFGDNNEDVSGFIKEFRKENRKPVPDLSLISFKDKIIRLRDLGEKIIFINFLSPSCMACRQELPKIRNLYDSYSQKKDVEFIFILNKPELKDETMKFFKECGIKEPTLTLVKNGSAWDYIIGEPTIWIIDKNSKIAAKHMGYRLGDENIFQEELSNLIEEYAYQK